MRLKGLNPLELHVEKVVVGVVALAALGILAWQFVGPPNRVMVKNRQVGIDEAYPILAAEADTALQRIRSTSPELPEVPPLDMLGRWEARMASAHTPSPPLAWAGEGRAASSETLPGRGLPEIVELRIRDLVPPPTSKPIAANYLATIAPEEVEAYPELAKVLPAAMPYDHAAVSVEASFSGTALRDMLATDPDGEGPLAKLPEHWWASGIQILDVRLERQELRDDGTWGDPVVVPPIPGQESLRTRLAAAKTAMDVRPLIDEAPKIVEDICRPAYYQIVFGDPWVPPSRMAAGRPSVDRGRIDNLLRQRESLEERLKTAEEDLAKVSDEDRSADAKRRNFQNRISEIQRQLDANREELVTAGHVFPDQPGSAAPATPAAATAAPLLSTDSMPLWAHDLAPERGRTYRYRFILAMRNPVYGQKAALDRESQALADSPVMLSKPSEWSDPVRVDPNLYFFITSARDPSRDQRNVAINSTPSASAEIYSFQWGYWRRATVSLEPGDPLVGELRVPDMAKVLAEAAQRAEQEQNPDANTPAPTTPDNGRPPEIPWQRLPVGQEGTFLLDVAAVPGVQGSGLAGGTGVQYRAFFRDGNGKIVVRNPETERANPAYQRVVASAQAGEEALRPRQVQVKKPTGREEREERPTDSGKGGGGGGG